MEIQHNKIYVNEFEPIGIVFTVSGTIMEGYDSVELHLRGKNEFFRNIELTIDVENSMCRWQMENDLSPGRYYYDVIGLNKAGHKIPFSDHPMYLEVLPCL